MRYSARGIDLRANFEWRRILDGASRRFRGFDHGWMRFDVCNMSLGAVA
jgi:hypothetical protein